MSVQNDFESPDFKSAAIASHAPELISRGGVIDRTSSHGAGIYIFKREPDKITGTISKEDFVRNLKLDSLPEMPIHYPLQKTHVVVSDLTPSTIAENIEDCLRRLSVQAKYDYVKATINAETHEHVKFDINFYKSTTEMGSFIVELHRLSSSSFGFRDEVRTILQSAKGAQFSPTPVKKRMSMTFVIPEALKESIDIDHNEVGLSALEEAAILLNKDRHDASELGIESMILLTDRNTTVEALASMAAKAVLYGDGAYGDLQSKIYNLVKCGKMYDIDNHFEDCISEGHDLRMRRGAMTVLYNSLNTLSCSSNHVLVPLDNIWCSEPLCLVLLQDLKNASFNPHDAHLAAKCLNSMMKMSDIFLNQMKGTYGILGILEGAASTGRSCHALLCNESDHVIQTLKA